MMCGASREVVTYVEARNRTVPAGAHAFQNRNIS